MIDLDMSNPINRVRVAIGDATEPYYISDDVLAYMLEEQGCDERQTAVKAVTYLVSYFTRMMDQEVGDVRVKFSQLLNNYKDLLTVMTTDSNYGACFSLHTFGGTDKAESERVKNSCKVNQPKMRVGFFTDTDYDKNRCPTHPYFLY